MRQYAVPESIPYAICYNAQNAHLAKYAAKCYKNAGKFFPDVADQTFINTKETKLQEAKFLVKPQEQLTKQTLIKFNRGLII